MTCTSGTGFSYSTPFTGSSRCGYLLSFHFPGGAVTLFPNVRLVLSFVTLPLLKTCSVPWGLTGKVRKASSARRALGSVPAVKGFAQYTSFKEMLVAVTRPFMSTFDISPNF